MRVLALSRAPTKGGGTTGSMGRVRPPRLPSGWTPCDDIREERDEPVLRPRGDQRPQHEGVRGRGVRPVRPGGVARVGPSGRRVLGRSRGGATPASSSTRRNESATAAGRAATSSRSARYRKVVQRLVRRGAMQDACDTRAATEALIDEGLAGVMETWEGISGKIGV